LFAGKKRMAFGANFNTNIGFGRTDFDLIATCASDAGVGVFWVDSVFHGSFNPHYDFLVTSMPNLKSKDRPCNGSVYGRAARLYFDIGFKSFKGSRILKRANSQGLGVHRI
jgi:hypothetical protein